MAKHKKPKQCSECNKLFQSYNRLQKHFDKIHSPTSFVDQQPCSSSSSLMLQCGQCSARSSNEKSLEAHVAKFHRVPYKCNYCLPDTNTCVTYDTLTLLQQHIRQNHRKMHQCTKCDKSFLRAQYLNRHLKIHDKVLPPKKEHQCQKCSKTFPFPSLLRRHLKAHDKMDEKKKKNDLLANNKKQTTCFNCSSIFKNLIALNKHLKTECVHLPINDISDQMQEIDKHFNISFSSALRGCFNKYIFTPKEIMANEKQCFDYLETDIISLLKSYNKENVLLKWSYNLNAQFTRMKIDGEDEYKNAGFSSQDFAFDNMDIDLIDDQITSMRNDVVNRIDKYSKEGSGWVLCKIISFNLYLYRFNLKGGGKIVALPPQLLNKHCVINIDCIENCFNYAVLSALHHSEVRDPQRVTSYNQYLHDYDFPSLPTVTASQVSKFVKTNNLPVFTHLYHAKKATDESYVECTYRPPKHLLLTNQERVHLLLFDGHWMPITK